MASLFQENQPSEGSSLQSAIIRENFTALFESLKTLEVRVEDPISTSVLILGGSVYFRPSTSQQLQLVNFSTRSFDINNTTGFKSVRSDEGILSKIEQNFRGVSAYESEGQYLEILISLKPNGTLTFTESTSAQNDVLSSSFNIFFDDSEVPLALVFLEKDSSGVLQKIQQTRISDIRPIVTTAFQNNEQAAITESQVQLLEFIIGGIVAGGVVNAGLKRYFDYRTKTVVLATMI